MAGLTPYAAGELVGFALGAGAVGYFLARLVLPPGRTAQVARLMDAAGVEEDPGTRRGWRPPPILIGLLVAAVAGSFKLAVVAPKGFSTQDVPQLRKGFIAGCVNGCTKKGAPAAVCEPVCSCVLDEVAAQNPDDQHMAAWFSGVEHKDAEAMHVLTMSQNRCLARAPQPEPQP